MYLDDVSVREAPNPNDTENATSEANYAFSPSLLFVTLSGSDDITYLGNGTYRLNMAFIPSHTIFTMAVSNVMDLAGNPLTPGTIKINDNDDDGMADDWEASNGVSSWNGDPDSDGLSNYEEYIHGTNPVVADTDADGIVDGVELTFWGDSWNADNDGDGIVNILDRDSDNDGSSDGDELNGGSDPADPSSNSMKIEVGEVQINHLWKRVAFSKPFADPIIVAKPLSYNGDDPAVVRIRNVDNTGFEIRVQEWEYLDGTHDYPENVGYVVMDRGIYTVKDGSMLQAGSFETNGTNSFVSVSLDQSFQAIPVILSAVTSFNEGDAVGIRIRNVSKTGFEFCMQEQELNSQVHSVETIHFIAWEPSMGIIDDMTFEVNKTQNEVTDLFHHIPFGQGFVNLPVFMADIQSADGMDTANLRWKNKGLFGIDIKIDEETSRDSETTHDTEMVGYMVFGRTE
jgi:hypothetical protein